MGAGNRIPWCLPNNRSAGGWHFGSVPEPVRLVDMEDISEPIANV